MKNKLLAVLKAQRELANACDELGAHWACDENSRNRPMRQKLTTDLINSLPRPLAFGELVYKIADECGIDL